MLGVLLVSFVKYVFNPYPSLHDISIILFLILMNVTFVVHYVEGLLVLLCAIFYGVITTWLLNMSWLKSFAGNANFVFF